MKNPKILVVDDDSAMRRLIVTVLRAMEFNDIYEAGNGQVALAMLKDHKIDFMITDWAMPVLDGLSLLKSVRADDQLKGLPILVLTAHGEKEIVMQAIQNGANNFLVKPFTPAALEKKIRLAMAPTVK